MHEYLDELDQMNRSARGNVLNQYMRIFACLISISNFLKFQLLLYINIKFCLLGYLVISLILCSPLMYLRSSDNPVIIFVSISPAAPFV